MNRVNAGVRHGHLKEIMLIAVAVILLAGGLAYWYFVARTEEVKEVESLAPVIPETPDVGSKIGELSNPLGDKLPSLNPVEQTNPFKDVKTNPFR